MSDELIRVSAIIIISAALIILLRSRLQEYAFLITVAVVAVVIILVCANLWGSIARLRTLFDRSGNANVYFVTALKALGIAYISGFAADVCRDFGLSSLANAAEITGKITIFALSIPLATAVMEAALKFIDL